MSCNASFCVQPRGFPLKKLWVELKSISSFFERIFRAFHKTSGGGEAIQIKTHLNRSNISAPLHAVTPRLWKVLPHCARCCVKALFYRLLYRLIFLISILDSTDASLGFLTGTVCWGIVSSWWPMSTNTRQVTPTRGEWLCMHKGLSERWETDRCVECMKPIRICSQIVDSDPAYI